MRSTVAGAFSVNSADVVVTRSLSSGVRRTRVSSSKVCTSLPLSFHVPGSSTVIEGGAGEGERGVQGGCGSTGATHGRMAGVANKGVGVRVHGGKESVERKESEERK